jgi:hypothetical protein
MGQEVNRPTTGRRKQICERRHLFVVSLGKKTVRRRFNQFIAITNGYNGAGQHPDLDWIGNTRPIDISRLVGDIEINIDGLTRDRGAVCEYGSCK